MIALAWAGRCDVVGRYSFYCPIFTCVGRCFRLSIGGFLLHIGVK